jgi:hypothetical protein
MRSGNLKLEWGMRDESEDRHDNGRSFDMDSWAKARVACLWEVLAGRRCHITPDVLSLCCQIRHNSCLCLRPTARIRLILSLIWSMKQLHSAMSRRQDTICFMFNWAVDTHNVTTWSAFISRILSNMTVGAAKSTAGTGIWSWFPTESQMKPHRTRHSAASLSQK